MRFFDCNTYFGLPSVRPLAPIYDAAELLSEMDRCGVDQALTWHIAQHDASPQAGNRLLEDGIRPYPRLSGCWTILPNQAGEFPPLSEFIIQMLQARIAALRVFPLTHHHLLNKVAMGSWLDAITTRRIPLFLSVARGANWDIVYNLLEEFPDMVCVICDHGCWGEDRRFRPLIEAYPRVYIDTSQYFLDGGIEAFVTSYGPERLLFGSGFPDSYFGGMMLAIARAEIAEEAKEAIAGGNLARLLSQANLEINS